MTNNTINVPRELLENIVLCYNEGEFELGTLAAECHALLSDPSPAGVDGCKCSMSISMLGDGCRHCQPQEYIDRLGEMLDEERAELSDAQAIIDGLRGEIEALHAQVKVLQSGANSWQSGYDEGRRMGGKHCALTIGQQDQRIGELEGLLREVRNGLSCENLHHKKSEQHAFDEPCKVLGRIDAALSAGKDSD